MALVLIINELVPLRSAITYLFKIHIIMMISRPIIKMSLDVVCGVDGRARELICVKIMGCCGTWYRVQFSAGLNSRLANPSGCYRLI